MLNIDGTTIELTCGDSAVFAITAKDKEGEAYEFQPGEKVKFTIKSTNKKEDIIKLVSKETIVEEASPLTHIILDPEDTKPLDFRKYYYDVQLIKLDGWVETIIANAIFKVGVEIG